MTLLIASIVVWALTKPFGKIGGIETAVLAALLGAVIYALTSFFISIGIISAVMASIIWIIALRKLYRLEWLKAVLTALIVWIAILIFEMFLPIPGGLF